MSLWDLIYSQDDKPRETFPQEKEIKRNDNSQKSEAFTNSYESDYESSAAYESDQSFSTTSGIDSEIHLLDQFNSKKLGFFAYRDKPVVGANARSLKIYNSSPEVSQ